MNPTSPNPNRAESPFMWGLSRLAWTSLVIAVTAIASSVLIGWLAYTTSRRAILNSVAQDSLSIGRTMINHIEHARSPAAAGTSHKDPTSFRRKTIDQIAAMWNRTEAPYPGSYVSVIEPGGKLALDTRKREMVGADVSDVIIDPGSSPPRRVSELLESKQSLATRNVNYRGNSQLAGYAYMPSIDSLVVVHVPSKIVEDKIRNAAIPWMIALGLAAGVLILLSIGLIHNGFLKSRIEVLDDSKTLIANEQQLQRQFAQNRAAERLRFTQFSVDSCSTSIFWVRANARFVYVNNAATQYSGYSRDELLSMTVHDIDPEHPADSWPQFWQEIRRRRTLSFESKLQRKDGTLIPVEITTNLLDFEGQEFLFAFVTDISKRHKSEQQLQESETRFRGIFEQAAVGVAHVDSVDGTILRINRRYCEILHTLEEELVGKTWMELTHPDDLERDLANMHRLCSGQIREFSLEKRLRWRDGAAVWINLTVSAMWRIGEEPSTHIAIVEDITERKEAELALRESEDLFRRLVQLAPFGVQRHDVDGRITFANEELGEIYGVKSEELIGKYIWEFAVDQPARRVMQENVRRQSSGSPEPAIEINTKNVTCDGRIIDVYINWTYDVNDEGHVVGFIVVVSDITERKKFERTLEFQADVLNRVNDAVLVTDRTGVVTYANEAARQLFHSDQAQLKGTTLSVLHDRLAVSGPSSQDIRAGLAETGMWQGENEFQFESEVRSFETMLKTFQPSDSDDRFIVSVVRDISPRKKAEQEQRQQRDTLAHMTRLSTMGELVAGIAHELKQPLHAISNYASAASISLDNVDPADPLTSDEIDGLMECNAGIQDASERANEIIQGLRAFSQTSDQRRESVNINQVVTNSIELVAFEARQSRTTVETVFAEKLPDVTADRVQIEQVVVNLLHNAYEILRKSESPRKVVIRTVKNNGKVEIHVQDTGPGIPKDRYGKLFEAFFTTKNNGMGMGLTISRTIVEDHGGRLWADNNCDAGATFHLSLPVAESCSDQA